MDDFSSLAPAEKSVALFDAYRAGLRGVLYDPNDIARLLGELKHPLFSVASVTMDEYGVITSLRGTSTGGLYLPYRSLVKFDPGAFTESQDTGDCVSHATRNACDGTRAVEIDLKGEPEAFVARGATEAIYGSRGDGGQGMYCSQAARFISEQGGILIRQKYPDLNLDLSKYTASIGINWGSRGIPDNVLKEAQKHQIKTVSLVTSTDDAADALANGYCLSVCSNQGFSDIRDSNGIADPSGSWYHGMGWLGVDDTRKRDAQRLFLICNSWGKWNRGGVFPEDQPVGSFWVREQIAKVMISQNGSYAVSNFDGFPPKSLPNWGFEYFGLPL